MQTTVSKTVQLSGIGLHSGCRVKMSVLPAPADTGIVFRRVDLPGKPEIRALYANVVNTQNCTCLGDADGNLVSTIEHVMAALSVRGVDNAVIEVDNQELPIMDGSGKMFYDALKAVELKDLSAPRMYLKVKRKCHLPTKTVTPFSCVRPKALLSILTLNFRPGLSAISLSPERLRRKYSKRKSRPVALSAKNTRLTISSPSVWPRAAVWTMPLFWTAKRF